MYFASTLFTFLYVLQFPVMTLLICKNLEGKMHWNVHLRNNFSMFLKQFISIQRTKSTLRSTAGRLCGTWKRTTTTKEPVKNATKRTTCTRDASVSANGSSGTFLPPPNHTPPPLIPPLSSDPGVRPHPLCGGDKLLPAKYAQIIQKHFFFSCLSDKRHSCRCAAALPSIPQTFSFLFSTFSDSNVTDKWTLANNNSHRMLCVPPPVLCLSNRTLLAQNVPPRCSIYDPLAWTNNQVLPISCNSTTTSNSIQNSISEMKHFALKCLYNLPNLCTAWSTGCNSNVYVPGVRYRNCSIQCW